MITTMILSMTMVVSTLMSDNTTIAGFNYKNMEHYLEQIQKSVVLLQQMQENSREFRMWKNMDNARAVITLLNDIPDRGESHTPYDKIFLLNILSDNISCHDTPRFALSVFRCMLSLFDAVQESDYNDYDDERIEREWIEESVQKWADYIDTEKVSNQSWMKTYNSLLKFDPIERTEKWEELYETIEAEIDTEIEPDMPRGMGFCYCYWSVKSMVLKKYGIEWQSPAEMNPGVLFD